MHAFDKMLEGMNAAIDCRLLWAMEKTDHDTMVRSAVNFSSRPRDVCDFYYYWLHGFTYGRDGGYVMERQPELPCKNLEE